MRMRLLPVSATMRFDVDGTMARPVGLLKRAPAKLQPSAQDADPTQLPMKDEVDPVSVIVRMQLLAESVTKTMPLRATATPVGPLKLAAVAAPSPVPWAPLPASVETGPLFGGASMKDAG